MLGRYTNAIRNRLPLIAGIRDDVRYRRAGLTFTASAGASAAAIVVNLVTVPLLLHYLGPTRFGVWMILFSFVSMLTFLDLGVGLGLLTAVARFYGIDDRRQARRYVSSAFVVLLSIAFLFFVMFVALYRYIPWTAIFNVQDPVLGDESERAVLILAACLAIAIPCSLPARVQSGYQQGYIAALWDLFARIAILVGVIQVTFLGAGLPALIAVVVGIPALAGLLNGLALFIFQSPWLRPSAAEVDLSAARVILHNGMLFFVLQMVVAVAFASDDLIIAQLFGPEAVGPYAVPRTLFQLVTGILSLLLVPLWPAYAEALAKGETEWVAKTLKRSLQVIALGATLGAFVLTIFGNTIIAVWTQSDLRVSYWLLAGFGLWTVVSMCGNAIAMVLNAASIIRFQVIVAATMAVFAVVAKIAFGHWFGVTGVIWGTVLAYGLSSFLPCAICVRRWLYSVTPTRGAQ